MSEEFRTLHVKRSTSTGHRLTHYDGVCGNIHGHNMDWELEVVVEMDEDDSSNMPLDLKDVAGTVDSVDHATVLSTEEADEFYNLIGTSAAGNQEGAKEIIEEFFGDVIWIDSGDPTCEVMAKWMARKVYQKFECVSSVEVLVNETEKYGISSGYDEYDEMMEQSEG